MKIDWNKVWDNFERWLQSTEDNSCSLCGQSIKSYPDWGEQQRRIQQIVNRQLRRKKC